jgi:hypothetical protein
VGIGKLFGPVPKRADGAEQWTAAKLIGELLYAGKTRREVAGYTDRFIATVLCLARDEDGQLLPDLPEGVHVDGRGMRIVKNMQSFETMFRKVVTEQGKDEDAAIEEWNARQEEEHRTYVQWRMRQRNGGRYRFSDEGATRPF